jgi:hypothetical protein
MIDGAGPGPGLNGDGSQWAKWEASKEEGDVGTTSSMPGAVNGKKEDDSAAVRGSIPVFASGLALLFTLAVAL